MWVMVIQNLDGALETVPKELVKNRLEELKFRGRIEIIQTVDY